MMTFLRQKAFFITLVIFTLSFSGLIAAHTLSPPSPHKHLEFIPAITFLLFGDDRVVDDNLNVATGQIDNSLNVLSNDNNVASATLVSFGGPAETNVSDQAIGATFTAASGAQISLAANGILTYDATGIAAATTGTDTIFYAVDNAGTVENGEITINYGEAPTALDGPDFNSLFSDTLTVTSGTGLLSNDSLGTPAATLVSFGGGDLGGSVTDNMAGENVSVAGGMLTVNADGSFTLTNPPLTDGVITFSYRIQNDFGFSDAVEEITITAAPTAQDDALTSKVNINNSFPANTLFNDNGNGIDDLGTAASGNPVASIASFGNFNNGSGNAAEFAFGTTQTIPAPINGDLTVNADGSLTINNPTADGSFTFQYTLDNGVGTASVATVTVSVVPAPVAQDDSYTFLGTVDQTVTAVNGLFVDNGSGADFLGTPASTLTSFGGGDLGGTVADNVANSSIAFTAAGGTLQVNSDGSFSLSGQPFNTGTYTFDYRLSNIHGTSDGTVTFIIQNAPVASDDDFTFDISTDQTSPNTLFVDNGNGADNLGIPAAIISSFGSGSLGGAITDNAAGASVSLAGGTLTLNANGSWTLTGQPFTPGTYTVDYRLTNVAGTSDATVTFDITEQPSANNDSYTFLATADQTVAAINGFFADNGSGFDSLGTPASTLSSFGGGDLGGTITSNTAGASVSLAGGTLTVNSDGSFNFSGQPFNTGTYTFDYRLTNSAGTSDATVTFIIQNLPIANDDNFSFDLAANQTSPNTLFVDNSNGADSLGSPVATITSFGSGSLGGAITDNAAGASVALAGGTLTLNANGSWTLTGQPFTTGTYTVDYRLTNAAGTSDATATFNITQQPSANDDSYDLQALIDATFNAANGVFVDNGSGADTLGSPTSTLTSFGGGDLGDTVTDNAAGSSVAFTAAGGNLTVNGDGSFSLTGQPFNEGTFTFDYRLTNSVGTADGTVTLIISNLPVAQDDDFTFSNTTNQASPNSLFVDNGNGADTVSGATIASFGGGSLGGAVTDNTAGNSVTLAGGSLTINANGTWSLTGQPFTGGTFTVDYRLTNAGGSSDATITLDITAPPVLTDDSPAAASVPGNDFHGALNTANNVANDDSDDLDQNDNLGNPAGTIDRFGAIQFNNGAGTLSAANGTVTDNVAGATLNLASLGVLGITDGSLTVNANGSYSFVPPSNYTGLFGFQYRVTNTQGSDTATVLLAVGNRPQCVADSGYTSSVNIPISVADGANDVLANDNGDALSVFTVQASAGNVGNTVAGNTNGSSSSANRVQLNANGSFNHSPAAGVVGANTFNYNVANGFGVGTTPCPVTVTTSLVSGTAAWFIDQSATGSNNFGTFDDPFTSIASFNTQNAAGSNQPTVNDRIYIDPDGTYNEADGINLLNNQHLSGGTVQFNTAYAAVAGGGATLGSSYSTFAGTAEGTRTAIAATAGDGIDLADANTVSGFNIGNTPAGFGLDGTAIGSPTINNVDISGTGGALRIGTSANLNNVTLGQVSSSSSVAENIRLIGATGALTLGSGGTGLSGSASGSNAIIVSGGSVSFTYADPISKTNAGRVALVESMTGGTKTLSGMLSSSGAATGILVQNNTAGTTNFSGAVKTINTGGNDAITLQNNAGSTTNFSGGGLDIDTTTGRGIFASNGGTVTISGVNNSVNTGSGAGIDVVNTTIGATGVTLQRVDSNGGTNAIMLNNTGTTGAFSVTGTGTTVGSGGSLQNTSGSSVLLTNANNVSLSNMTISNTGLHGIQGTTISDMDVANTQFTNIGSGTSHHGIFLTNLSGTGGETSVFDDITMTSPPGRGIYVTNSTATGELSVQGASSFTNSGLQGILLETTTSAASLTSTIGNTSLQGVGETVTFSGASAASVDVPSVDLSVSGGSQTTTIRNSLFNAGTGDLPNAIEGFSTGTAGNSSLTATVTGNNITIPSGAGTGRGGIIFNTSNATGIGSTNGTISSNTINSPEVTVIGIGVSNTGSSTATDNSWNISNNVINLTASGAAATTQGIFIEANSSTANTGISAVITNNNVVANGGSGFTTGIGVVAGNANNANLGNACTSISGNTASAPNATLGGNVPAGSADIVVLSFSVNTISVVGLPLGNATATAVDTQVTANNTADTFVFPNAASSYMGIASCP